MDYLKLFNENVLYLYIDLNENDINNNENIINKIENLLKEDKLYFIEIIKEKILKYKEEILNENIKIIEIINNLFIYKLNLEEIYKKVNKEKKEIIWKYLKIFVILCENYYFTL